MKTLFLILWTVTLVSGQCSKNNSSTPVTTENVISLSNGSSEFALSLFKTHLANNKQSDNSNFFISPISIWSALTLTYLGCEGQTATELGKVLHVDKFAKDDIDNLYTTLKDDHLIHNLSSDSKYTFKMANKLYFDESIQLRQCIKESFVSNVEKAQFATAPEEWRQKINRWVETETNDKIKELLLKQNIDSITRMVIVNAAYFKAAWTTPFPKELTAKEDFFVKPNQPIKVDMMRNDGYYFWGESPKLGCLAIVLPYFGQDVSLIVLLPNTRVDDLVPKLTTKDLDDLYKNTTLESLRLSFPKFKIEDQMDLIDTMKLLGVRDLFQPGKADLSGFSNTTGNLHVNFIRHKTFIDLNESGTEAAAATAVGATRSAGLSPNNVVVNKPFVFVIRNNNVGTYLFMGVVREPKLS